jgi:PAS domain S-box-containing protein
MFGRETGMNNNDTLGNAMGQRDSDVSGQASALQALRDSELRYRRLFESARDGILILDAQTGMVVDVNPFLVELLGFSHEEFLGKKVWELGFFRDIIANQDKFEELQQKDYIRYADMPLETKDGRRINVEFVSNVYLVNGQRVIQCNIRDITAPKQARAYQDMSTEIRELLNESGDLADTIQRVLATVKKMTGCDAVGLRLQDGEDFPYFAQQGFSEEFLLTENSLLERDAGGGVCRDKDGNVRLECTCGLVLSGKTDVASPLFTKRGSFWTNDSLPLLGLPSEKDPRHHPRNECIHQGYASVALVPIHNKERIIGLLHLNDRRKGRFSLEAIELLEGIAEHIGELLLRKRVEQELMDSKALTEAIVENIPLMIFLIEATDMRLVIFNRAGEEIMGYDRKDLLGRNNINLFPPEQAANIMAKDREALEGEAGIVDIPEETILTGKRGDRLLHTRKVRILGGDGKTKYLLGVSEDITDRKRAEVEHLKLQGQLAQAQKMEAVGRLAGGVAHDFNNLLTGIMGYTELCRDRIAADHPIRNYLDEIMRVALQSAEITRQLLAFASKQTIAPRVLDLNDAVAGLLKLLRRLIGEDIKLTWRPGMNLLPVKLDPAQVDQILANLCVNSRDAISGVGEVALETGSIAIDAEFCARHPDAIPGEYVFLAVSDNGCGMDKETLAQVFEPFFTTKGLGKGTGIGLATVYGIVKQNNGFIYAYSEPGKGATFKVYLPAIAAEVDAAVASKAKAPGGRGETILLVEDEKSLRATCSLFLEILGYHVLVAETPGDALKLTAQHPGDIHVLLTDVVMPGMDGLQLAKRICAIKPGVKVLYMSGYTADVIARRGVLDEGVQFLAKPFSRDDLARKVRQVLEPD